MSRPVFVAAVVQRGVEAVTGKRDARAEMADNRDAMIRWLDILQDTATPPKLVVFPVLSFLGASRRPNLFPPGATDLAFTDPFFAPLIDACARYDCYLATSCVEIHPAFPGRKFHTGFLLGPNGLVARQPKVQARSTAAITVLKTFRADYAAALGEDAVHVVADTPIGKIGIIVESEQLYPEVVRSLAKRGAEIIVHPNLEFPGMGIPFDAIKQARAWENSVYLVSAAASFERWPDGDTIRRVDGRGGSLIAGPDGAILAHCGFTTEGFAMATIDLTALDAVRADPLVEKQPDYSLYAPTYSD